MLASIVTFMAFFALGACTGQEKRITDPADPDFNVRYEVFSKSEKGGAPWVIIFPPTGGVTALDRTYARGLSQKGASVFLVVDWSQSNEEGIDAEIHDRHLARALRVFDLLRKEANGEPVRLFGTSLGGMYAASIAARRDGVERLATVVAGGPLGAVLAHSQLDSEKKRRADRAGAWGFKSEDEYEAMLADSISLDFVKPRVAPRRAPGATGGPTDVQGFRVSPANIYVIMAGDDVAVPTDTQTNLWRAMGSPNSETLSGGHAAVIAKTVVLENKSLLDFLTSAAE